MKIKAILVTVAIALIATLGLASNAWGFCGFYVGKADSKLYNQASQVILARDGDRTILTMANDYQGEMKDFALVVPVPTVLQAEQVRIGDPKIIERLDAFSAPRLVEYFDRDPCEPLRLRGEALSLDRFASQNAKDREQSLGVTVEAKFTVGEYDIVILSAKESNGLETWLKQNGYKIPRGASDLLRPYIRQGMKFFVAKVNLTELSKSGSQFLRPLQIAYQSEKFILPIRLGMVNSTAEQDLIAYVISPKGQAEITNYRTVNIPSNTEIPLFVKDEFGDFYKSLFQTAYKREGQKVAFLEYAWNMASCDPCSAEPLNQEELKKAGVFWLSTDSSNNAFLSRFHIRYTRNKFPEDLMFQETGNNQFFQGRYILRHPFKGESNCEAAQEYRRSLPQRFEQEAQTLAQLTGWNIQDIRKKVTIQQSQPEPFWRNIWN